MEGEFAARYGELEIWHWWFRGRRRILETMLRRRLAEPVRRLASVGSGPPAGLVWLRPFASQVLGVDADPSGALLAAALPAGSRRPGITFLYGDLEALPLRPSSLDLLLALDVLEHLEDDTAALRSAVSLVRPGGLVVITVPAFPSLWGRQDVVSHHWRRYTWRGLRRLLSDAGLEQIELFFFNTLLFPAVALIRWGRRLARPLVRRAEAAGSDFDAGRPGMLNDLLAGLFAAERHLVGRVPLPFGVSLLATARAPARAPRE